MVEPAISDCFAEARDEFLESVLWGIGKEYIPSEEWRAVLDDPEAFRTYLQSKAEHLLSFWKGPIHDLGLELTEIIENWDACENQPSTDDPNWQDNIETGEPMSPIDLAFAVLKMPVYQTDVPGIQFVTQGEDDPVWMDDPNVYGRGPSEGPTEMWTPNEFLQYWDGSPYEGGTPRELGYAQREHGYKTRMDAAQTNEDIKFGMPWLSFVGDDEHPRWHDGRHRMAELVARGHGDTPVPVRVNRQGQHVGVASNEYKGRLGHGEPDESGWENEEQQAGKMDELLGRGGTQL